MQQSIILPLGELAVSRFANLAGHPNWPGQPEFDRGENLVNLSCLKYCDKSIQGYMHLIRYIYPDGKKDLVVQEGDFTGA
jgi:hypothetical protein